jgi:hypothetical protein
LAETEKDITGRFKLAFVTYHKEKDRLLKNQELILRGNHKSALKYTAELQKSLEKEIKQGWFMHFPFPTSQSYKMVNWQQ